MKKVEEKIAKRVEQLIQKGNQLLGTRTAPPPNVGGFNGVDTSLFHEWRNSVENLFKKIDGSESIYLKNFREEAKLDYESDVHSGMGILLAFKDDLENGFLVEVEDLIVAEVFTDILEMAEHLLSNGYKNSAASLIGAVLEDSLRKIVAKNGLTLKTKSNINSLNGILADNKIYNSIVRKRISTWNDLRNKADHGEFEEYSKEDVEDMHKGISRFLSEHLAQ